MGLFTGSSRIGISGVVLPAIIGLIAGYLGFLFSTNKEVVSRHAIPACLLALIISATFTGFFGSEVREANEQFVRDWEKHLIAFKEIEVPLERKRLEMQQAEILKNLPK